MATDAMPACNHEPSPGRKTRTSLVVRRRTLCVCAAVVAAGAVVRALVSRAAIAGLDQRDVARVAFVLALGQPRDRCDALALFQIDQAHALRVPTDDPDLAHADADDLASARHEH